MMKKIVIGFVLVVLMVGFAGANIVSSSDPEYKTAFYESKYAPVEKPVYSEYGFAVVRFHGVVCQDNTVFYMNDAAPQVFKYAFHPDLTVAPPVPKFGIIKVDADGTSVPEEIAAGSFTAYLSSGNGGQTEIQKFNIGNGKYTYIPFMCNAKPM